MSSIYRKVEYECDGQCYYGSCDKKNVFILHNHMTCDIFHVYQIHHKDSDSPLVTQMSLTDDDFSALYNLLTKKDTELDTLDDRDREIVELARKM